MRAVVQRVNHASVSIDGSEVARISKGFLILLGISDHDTEDEAVKLWNKIYKMRIFDDQDGKSNLSLSDVDGEVLVVSQFTLFANCKKGNRPSFTEAGKPEIAIPLYEYFIELAKQDIPHVGCGVFGADMDIELLNHGPFTILLDTDTL